jgi:hypothetical protein
MFELKTKVKCLINHFLFILNYVCINSALLIRFFALLLIILIPSLLFPQSTNTNDVPFSIPTFKALAYDEVERFLQDPRTVVDSEIIPDNYAGIYQVDDQYIIQFYNGTGILLPAGAPISSVSGVRFHSSFYPFKNTGLTYSIIITEETFNELGGAKEEIEGLGRHGAIEFFRGKGDLVLAYWSVTGWFLVLESPRTMASLDLEMANYVALGRLDEAKIISTGKPTYKIQEADYFKFDLTNGQCDNIEVAIKQLSEMLLISESRLDFSETSLTILDQALYWNMNRADAYALNSPLIAYVGECIRKAKGKGWYWSEYVSLMDNSGNEIEIIGDVHKSVIGSDHGWFVSHIYGNAMR